MNLILACVLLASLVSTLPFTYGEQEQRAFYQPFLDWLASLTEYFDFLWAETDEPDTSDTFLETFLEVVGPGLFPVPLTLFLLPLAIPAIPLALLAENYYDVRGDEMMHQHIQQYHGQLYPPVPPHPTQFASQPPLPQPFPSSVHDIANSIINKDYDFVAPRQMPHTGLVPPPPNPTPNEFGKKIQSHSAEPIEGGNLSVSFPFMEIFFGSDANYNNKRVEAPSPNPRSSRFDETVPEDILEPIQITTPPMIVTLNKQKLGKNTPVSLINNFNDHVTQEKKNGNKYYY